MEQILLYIFTLTVGVDSVGNTTTNSNRPILFSGYCGEVTVDTLITKDEHYNLAHCRLDYAVIDCDTVRLNEDTSRKINEYFNLYFSSF